MIVDSSAIVAILFNEPAAKHCIEALLSSPENRISAASFLEAGIVVDRLPPPREAMTLEELIGELHISIEPVTAHQARIALEAHRRYGKGTGHPARLNFGDCFAYALAIAFDEPLLFIGQDFVHTDVRRVLS